MALNFLVVLSLAMLAICLALYWKVRKIHLGVLDFASQQSASAGKLYRQLESLIGIYQTLPFQRALPPLRGWAGSPDYLLELARHTLQRAPNVVVECGSGSSSLIIGSCLKKLGKGHCYSLDHDSGYAQKTREELVAHGLDQWVTVLDAPLVQHRINGDEWSWYSLDELPVRDIELLNVDGPPMDVNRLARYPVLPLLKDRIASNCVILMDDAARADETAIVQRWMSEFSNVEAMSVEAEKGLAVLKMSARSQ